MGMLPCLHAVRNRKDGISYEPACEARGFGDVHVTVIIGSTLGGHNAEELI